MEFQLALARTGVRPRRFGNACRILFIADHPFVCITVCGIIKTSSPPARKPSAEEMPGW
jgi:hypothetical protein